METEIREDAYKIITPIFQGPFSLLLSLIENRKLFINDLSLAQVTEDYLKYINEIRLNTSLDPAKQSEQIASFIVVAATLLLIKSKSLLPSITLTEEEEGDIHNLEDRLKLYDFYTKLGIHVKDNFGKNIIFAPMERKFSTVVFLPDAKITKESMMNLVHEILGRIPAKNTLPKVEVKKLISIEEMIDKLTERIQTSLSINFKDFTSFSGRENNRSMTKEERVTVIVGFLAMLELARQGILNLVQDNNFEDIIINKTADNAAL